MRATYIRDAGNPSNHGILPVRTDPYPLHTIKFIPDSDISFPYKIFQRAEYREQRGEEDSQIAGQAEKLR